MGAALSCLPCAPAYARHEAVLEPSNEAASRAVGRANGVQARGGDSAGGVTHVRHEEGARTEGDRPPARGLTEASVTKDEEVLLRSGSPEHIPAALNAPPAPSQAQLARKPSVRGDLLRVLEDARFTSGAILAATLVGGVVSHTTQSGLFGALVYMVTLLLLFGASMVHARRSASAEDAANGGELAPAHASEPADQSGQMEASGAAREDFSFPTTHRGGAANPEAERGADEMSSPSCCQGQPPPPSAPVATPLPAQRQVTEPRTGKPFPYLMDEHSGFPREVEVLAGLGCRQKKVAFANLDIYGVGLYVNAAQFHVEFGSGLSRSSPVDLLREFSVATQSVSRTIRICIQFRALTSAMLVNSFDELLAETMAKAGEEAIYEELRKGLGSIALTPGRVILLRMTTDGTLVASSGEEELARTQSHILCRAVTEIYTGETPVSPLAKKSFLEGIADLPALVPPPEGGDGLRTERSESGDFCPEAASGSLAGKWEVSSAEGVDELLTALGLSAMLRHVAHNVYAKDAKIIQQEGTTVSFCDFRNGRKGEPLKFVEGQRRAREDKRGKALSEVARWEGNVLTITTEGYESPLRSTYWRKSRRTMVSETSMDGVVMRRSWRAIEA